MESVSYFTLDVTVLRAKVRTSYDYWSNSDLYVALSLPTATAATRRTKTISHNNQPEWNEGFSFRVPTQTKNILEISVFDEDLLSRDDLVSTVLLDLATLDLDSRLKRVFNLSPETEDVLEMEFELKNSEDQSQDYPSNGILLAAPLSVLSVRVQKLKHSHYLTCSPTLKLSGAYEGSQTLDPDQDRLQFHMNRELYTELGLSEVKDSEEMENKKEVFLSAVPLKPLPLQHRGNVSLTLDQDTVDLQLESRECSSEHLDVRLDLDVPLQEKEFLQKRRRVVAKALQTLLELDSPLSDHQVPVIAVVASGGGARACTATLGAVKGLKELGVLDAVTYFTAVSGATWGLSRLYQDQDWTQNLDFVISQTREQMTKDFKSAFAVDKLRYYHEELEEKERQGQKGALVDLAGLIVEHIVYGQKNCSTLSDQQRALKDGQNPLPIYTAVNSIKVDDGHQPETEWVEFTPFEVGLQKYGAFVRAEDFGSEFFLGHVMKKLPEMRLPFLIGIWSSIFSYTLETIMKKLTGSVPLWAEDETIIHSIEEDNGSSSLDTLVLTPDSGLSAVFSGFYQNRPILNQTLNFSRGLSLHQLYSRSPNFLTSRESHPDALPNRLTPSEPTLRLVDSGLSIKIACPSVLRPERLADVLIILSNGWDPDEPFKVLEKTVAFCEERGIPFPKADYKALQQQPLKEIYVFEDPEMPRAPIVLHLPLVNDTFKEFKAPGVPRVSPEDLAGGQVDVSSEDSPYTTDNMTYSTSDYDALIHLTSYNILNNRHTILSAIHRALSRK